MQITLANPTHIHEVMSLFNENLDSKNSLYPKHLEEGVLFQIAEYL